MKFEELKNKITEGTTLEKLQIEVKQYLPFLEKELLIDQVVSTCVEDSENGMKHISHMTKALFFDMSVIANYTDIELEEGNLIEQYDFLKSNGIIKDIKFKMNQNELFELNQLLDLTLEQEIRNHNTVEASVKIALNQVVNKLPDPKQLDKIISKVAKSIGNFDLSKIANAGNVVSPAKGEGN